jgi:chromosome partitioning protein
VHIIAISNQKGGVGKTTTCVNLGASLAVMEKKVLIIDCDPQGNATSGLGLEYPARYRTLYELLFDNAPCDVCVHKTQLHYLSLIPASPDLVGMDLALGGSVAREFILRDRLSGLGEKYDFVLLDAPPSLGLLTVNALCAANQVLIPLQCEYYALEGMTQLMSTVREVQSKVNNDLSILGVALTMFDKRNKLSFQVEKEAREHFSSLTFRTRIPRNVRLSEAPSHGKPAILYDIRSTGTQAYIALAKEIMARLEKKNSQA